MPAMLDLKILPTTVSDAANFHAWRLDEDARTFVPTYDLETLTARLQAVGGDLADHSHNEFAWRVDDGTTPVGFLVLKQVDWAKRSGEIGFLFDPAARGKGYGKASAQLLVEKIFAESPLRTLLAYTHAANIASQKILLGLGFTRKAPVARETRVTFEKTQAE
jgi:RimJ/RimL family protein N-acetyltransferase